MPTSLQNFTHKKMHANMLLAWFFMEKPAEKHVFIGVKQVLKQAIAVNLGSSGLLQNRYNSDFMGCKSCLKPYNKNIVIIFTWEEYRTKKFGGISG